jgi:hypothetical protein
LYGGKKLLWHSDSMPRALFVWRLRGFNPGYQHAALQRRTTVAGSLLRARFGGLNAESFKGKTVAVDFYGLTSDRDFAREFFTAWLQSQQVQIVENPKEAELRLKVFAPVLAVDQGQSFFGAPSFTVPVLGFAVPEIPLFKDVRHSGHAEVEIYTLDADSGKFIDKSATAVGAAQYDDYTLLLVINFTRTDVDKPIWAWQPGAG